MISVLINNCGIYPGFAQVGLAVGDVKEILETATLWRTKIQVPIIHAFNPLTAKCIYICKIKNEIFIEYDSSLLAELYDKFSSILVYGK